MNQLTPRKVSDSLFASLAIIGLAEELAHRKESGSPVGKLSASRWRNRPRSERMSVNKIAIWIQTDQRRPWNTGRCYTSLHYCLHDNTRPCGSYRQILRPHCHHRDGEPGLFLGHWKFCGAFHQRSGGCCLSGQTFVDQMQASGLTWQAYCESGCPRGPDHFPFIAFSADVNSPNVFASSSVSTSDLVSAANSANPPNFLWYTPTDGHNMHDNSVSTGDSYLQQFLVGSGTVQNPASGSLLASNVFKNSGFHTMLYLWWDEYDPSPNVEYGSMVKTGYTSTTSYDEYSSLRTLEDNWGLSHLANAASAVGLTDLLTTGGGSQPVQTTAAVINSGIYPTRDWLTQKHTYSSTGVPSSGTLVEIKNAVLSSVANGASSGDCNDSRDTPPAPSGTWCDSTAYANDGTGTVHVEIDQVYKYLGIAPADWPANSATVDIIGYTFMDGEGGGTSWEIHPVTAWSLSGSSSGTFTLTVSAGSGGSTSPAPGSYSEASGSVVTVTAVPSSGYTFNGFTLDGVVSASNSILVTMNANHAVSASFSQSISTTGNFGSCTSLPQGWNCDNTNGLTGSVATIVNGVAETV